MNRKALQTVLPDTVPVLTGYLFLGVGFGILLNENGYLIYVLALTVPKAPLCKGSWQRS